MTRDVPYANLTNDAQVVKHLSDGCTPSMPGELSPQTRFQAHLWICCHKCWQITPSLRPKAIELAMDLQLEI